MWSETPRARVWGCNDCINLYVAESPNLQPGSNTLFTATVYDQNNQGVTWTVSPLNFGTLKFLSIERPIDAERGPSVNLSLIKSTLQHRFGAVAVATLPR